MVYAALLLSVCMSERQLVSSVECRTPYPHVYADGDIFNSATRFTVSADGADVVTCSSVISAITACFILYWLFNIEYPKLFRSTLSFLDIHVFKKASVKSTQKITTFVNKL